MPKFAEMKTKCLLILLLAVSAVRALGQRQLVVADLETELPVAQVSVQGPSEVLQSDSLGRFMVSDSVRTLVLSHVNYESRIVNLDEVRDTVFLVSKYLSVREVVVFGKGRVPADELAQLKKSIRMARTEAQLAAADPSQANLLPLLSYLVPKKWKKSHRKAQRRKRHEDILREY